MYVCSIHPLPPWISRDVKIHRKRRRCPSPLRPMSSTPTFGPNKNKEINGMFLPVDALCLTMLLLGFVLFLFL